MLYHVKPYFLRMGGITLGEADEQIGQCEGAGSNSYRSSDVKVLERLAADPYALDSRDIFVPMTIRLITPSDRSEWLRLLLGLHPELAEAAHVPSIDAYLSGNSVDELIPSAVFVAERPNSRLGGFLELSIRNYAEGCSGDTPYVESWFVDEDLRGTGIGRALMEAAEQWARQRGFSELASDALLDNSLSHAAHQAVGFEVVESIVVFRKAL